MILLVVFVLLAVADGARAQCIGDCDGDLSVTVSELIQGVHVVLGRTALSQCGKLDGNEDFQATIDELVAATNFLRGGCDLPTPTGTPTPPEATPTASPTAAFPAAGKMVAIGTGVGGLGDVWTIDFLGNAQNLTNSEASETMPEWNPDGTRIAFAREGFLAIVDADGSNLRVLSEVRGSSPTWSPDGSSIAFVSTNGLERIQADGSGRRVIVERQPMELIFNPAWGSNDRIAFESTRGQASSESTAKEIWTVGGDGLALSRVTSNEFEDLSPTWSPDAEWIAVATRRLDRESRQLYLMRPDGSGETKITNEERGLGVATPSWSSDGRAIVYEVGIDGLVAVPPNGSARYVVPMTVGRFSHPDVR